MTIPQRKCIVCRRLRPRTELVRMVASTRNGPLVPNANGRLSGKGHYVCRSGDCVAKLRTDRKMRKVFAARIDESTYEWLTEQVQEDVDITSSPTPPAH